MTEPVPELRRRYLQTFRVPRIPHRFADVLILGSGVAGLSAALAASARADTEVLLVSKDTLEEGATRWAQGGVAAVLRPDRTGDSLEAHVQDTLEGAAGLADEETVRILVEEGADRVRHLIELGARFDRDASGELLFTREGGHSRPRILHRGDTTGQEIERALLAAVRNRRNVFCLPHTYGLDLLLREGRCSGALLRRPEGGLEAAWARGVVLATGGAGRLWRETTNPAVATGDGLAMAFRAGAELQDLEFVQFHPTTLYVAGADRFLITEAVRGEGGVLRDGRGEAFMARFHPQADLAPRDVVSRAILTVLREGEDNKVWLDLSAIPEGKARERFPRIFEVCRRFGIHLPRDPIPVRPSAHYSIGGVRATAEGRTSLSGLLAAGEVACTGVHGANRLGSNSLLEGLVFGHRCGVLAAREAGEVELPTPFSTEGDREAREDAGLPRQDDGPPGPDEVNLEDLQRSLKSVLWYRVGAERDGKSLRKALEQIGSWLPYCLGAQFHGPASWSLQNMMQTAFLVTLTALRREESRGVHFRSDYPERDDTNWRRHSVLCRDRL